jgi:hypothetical protein
MDRMEDELRSALRREEPDAGFAERVLARVDRDKVQPRRSSWLSDWFRVPVMRYATVAALCTAFVIGIDYQQERRTRVQGEEAKQKLMLALQITSSKLELTRVKLREVSDRQ